MVFSSKISKTIEMCRCCFMCRHACPLFLVSKLDSHTPRGYAINLSRINEGMADWDEEGIERLFHCSQCGLCRELCAFHWPEDEMVLEGRRVMVKQRKEPGKVKSAAAELKNRCSINNIIFDAAVYDRKNADVLYLCGSALLNGQDEIIKGAAAVFDACGADWTMLGVEDAGGPALYELGYGDESERQLAEAVSNINPKVIITSCAHTYSMLKKAGWKERIKLQHMLEYIYEKIGSKELLIRENGPDEKVMYHDPCHIGRENGIYDIPRDIIKKCTGSAPEEFHHSRNEAECCGAGACIDIVYPETALLVAGRRTAYAAETGAAVIVTACPNCKKVFQKACGNNGIEVKDIAEYILPYIIFDKNLHV